MVLLGVTCVKILEGGPHRCKAERVDFYTERGNVLLLELTRQMSLDEGGLQIRPC